MKSFILIAFLAAFSTPTNADMQLMLDNFKSHNSQIMDLKKKPENYGLAPRGFFEIKQNAKNRKLCSNQLAKIEVK